MSKPRRIYLAELATIVDRVPHTIRQWDGSLPEDLKPHRDERGWRYWTPAQAQAIKAWMKREGRAPGKGLSGFKPSPERVREMLEKLRQPRPGTRKDRNAA